MGLLDNIKDSSDIKKLSIPELYNLAGEIRELLIDVCSTNGGHIAPSLGTVELTLALHYVFDISKNPVVWDVGHQSYTHKILTGRKDKFHTLRQFGGISGFTSLKESKYDYFGTGHAGTSISATLGILEGKNITNKNHKTIAVIGDGAMTSGISFEALNQAGYLQRDIIVILNDNEMSISKNVGALQSFISRKITERSLLRFRKKLKDFIKNLPGFGESLYYVLKKAEDSWVSFFTPGIIFEGLGFHYLGPIDGHKIEHLIETFEHIYNWEGPILVHVLTKKGKGYKPAEENPELFHGIGPFDKTTGKVVKKSNLPSYSEIFGRSLTKFAETEKKIIAITAAMSKGTGLDYFKEKFPDRFYDVGIAEQHAVTFAGGIATQGLKPVVAIYSTFLQRAYDQIVHDICLQDLPVIFAIDRAGIVGEDGPTHQGLLDISYFINLPDIVIMTPSNGKELFDLLYTALSINKPCAIRYPRGNIPDNINVEKETPEKVQIGKFKVLSRGKDISIFALGKTLEPAMKCAEKLEKKGISVFLVNSMFAKPIDESVIIEAVKKTKVLLTVEDGIKYGGFGSFVNQFLSENGLIKNLKFYAHGYPTPYITHGAQGKIQQVYNMDSSGIFNLALKLLDRG